MFVVGDGIFSHTRKGLQSSKHTKLASRLAHRVAKQRSGSVIVGVDEYKSSQHCPRCLGKLKETTRQRGGETQSQRHRRSGWRLSSAVLLKSAYYLIFFFYFLLITVVDFTWSHKTKYYSYYSAATFTSIATVRLHSVLRLSPSQSSPAASATATTATMMPVKAGQGNQPRTAVIFQIYFYLFCLKLIFIIFYWFIICSRD